MYVLYAHTHWVDISLELSHFKIYISPFHVEPCTMCILLAHLMCARCVFLRLYFISFFAQNRSYLKLGIVCLAENGGRKSYYMVNGTIMRTDGFDLTLFSLPEIEWISISSFVHRLLWQFLFSFFAHFNFCCHRKHHFVDSSCVCDVWVCVCTQFPYANNKFSISYMCTCHICLHDTTTQFTMMNETTTRRTQLEIADATSIRMEIAIFFASSSSPALLNQTTFAKSPANDHVHVPCSGSETKVIIA